MMRYRADKAEFTAGRRAGGQQAATTPLRSEKSRGNKQMLSKESSRMSQNCPSYSMVTCSQLIIVPWVSWHDDVIKWKHFPRYSPFVRGNHRSSVNSPAQWPVTRSFGVFFDLGDLRRHRAHYDGIVMNWLVLKARPLTPVAKLWCYSKDCHNTF